MTLKELREIADRADKTGMILDEDRQYLTPGVTLQLIERVKMLTEALEYQKIENCFCITQDDDIPPENIPHAIHCDLARNALSRYGSEVPLC